MSRHLGLARRALRRPVDRVESWILLALVAVFLLVAPVAAVHAWHVTYASGARAEGESRFRQQAVLLDDPSAYAPSGEAGTLPRSMTARARWTAPDGAVRTGRIMLSSFSRAGSTVTVWTDARGRPTGPPRTHRQTVRDAVAAGGLGVTALGVLLAGMACVVRRVLDGRRYAAWQAEWLRVEPRWSGRR